MSLRKSKEASEVRAEKRGNNSRKLHQHPTEGRPWGPRWHGILGVLVKNSPFKKHKMGLP